jgi:hypothetical protein
MQTLQRFFGRQAVFALTLLAVAVAIPTAYAESGGASIVVSHKVESFEKWKPVFDSTASWKVKFGWKQSLFMTADNDRNNVTVIEEFDTLENARKFASSPELKTAMGKAGVTSPPDVHFFNNAAVAMPK